MIGLNERMAKVESQMRAFVEARGDRDKQLKGFHTQLADIDSKLGLLLQDKDRRDGALGLGRWLLTIGVPSLIGGAALWLWNTIGER